MSSTTAAALNDYFAHSFLDLSRADDAARFNAVLRTYDSHGVRRIFLATHYDLTKPVALQLEHMKRFKLAARAVSSSRVNIKATADVMLTKGISDVHELSRLAVTSPRGGRYIFLSIPPSADTDSLIHELHNIIYRLNLIPVITSIEKTFLYLPAAAVDSLYKIPNAVYQVNLASLQSRSSLRLVHDMLTRGKTVIFGSGDKFDACPYANHEYYTKLISRAVGDTPLGYFAIRHNRVFS